ncbi:MAG: hypothetical protein AAF330_03620 [Pseudomonadota bacterium]
MTVALAPTCRSLFPRWLSRCTYATSLPGCGRYRNRPNASQTRTYASFTSVSFERVEVARPKITAAVTGISITLGESPTASDDSDLSRVSAHEDASPHGVLHFMVNVELGLVDQPAEPGLPDVWDT